MQLHSDDTGVLAGLVFLTALLVGPCIPAADLIFGSAQTPFDPKVLAFVLALGLVGAYAGVVLRKTLSAAADLYR